jgi:hypothetical protein
MNGKKAKLWRYTGISGGTGLIAQQTEPLTLADCGVAGDRNLRCDLSIRQAVPQRARSVASASLAQRIIAASLALTQRVPR